MKLSTTHLQTWQQDSNIKLVILNKVPGSVPEKQRTPISGTQLGTAITFKLLGQMTSNLNHS